MQLDHMSISSLRNLIQDDKLEVDGSRELLLQFLKPVYEPQEDSKGEEERIKDHEH
jgi:hypothetical protein